MRGWGLGHRVGGSDTGAGARVGGPGEDLAVEAPGRGAGSVAPPRGSGRGAPPQRDVISGSRPLSSNGAFNPAFSAIVWVFPAAWE